METENQESQPSNAMAFGLLAIVLVIILVVIFTVDFSGGDTPANTAKESDTEQSDKPASAAAKYAEGKSLFKSNCAACHNPKTEGTGPALLGARARWQAAGEYKGKTGEQWMYEWVKDWNSVVAVGYPHAVEMANSRATTMNSFPYLKDKEIEQIFTYIDSTFSSNSSKVVAN